MDPPVTVLIKSCDSIVYAYRYNPWLKQCFALQQRSFAKAVTDPGDETEYVLPPISTMLNNPDKSSATKKIPEKVQCSVGCAKASKIVSSMQPRAQINAKMTESADAALSYRLTRTGILYVWRSL